jgi:hypothetical protein
MSHVNDEGITVNLHSTEEPEETPTGGEPEKETSAQSQDVVEVEKEQAVSDAPIRADAGPAPAEEAEPDVFALKQAIDTAKTPEEKAAAQKAWNYAWMKQRQENQELKERLAYLKGKAESETKRDSQDEVTPDRKAAPALPELQLPPKPQRGEYLDVEGYEDSEAYEVALARWGGMCAIAEENHKGQIKQYQTAQTEAQTKQTEWEENGESKYPGFRKKIDQVLKPMFTAAPQEKSIPLSVAISESDKTHDLTIYLANNPKEVERLLSLSPASAAREVGKLEMRLEKAKPRTTTAAPAPITPIGGATAPEDDSGLPDNDFFAKEKRRIAETGRYY